MLLIYKMFRTSIHQRKKDVLKVETFTFPYDKYSLLLNPAISTVRYIVSN